jgi:transcriptional regulator with XRE-family HTH domain
MDFNGIVGANIAAARKARRWSQADLASALERRGISFQQQTVLKVEKGSRPLKLEEAVIIADELGIVMDDLVTIFREELEARTKVVEARAQLRQAELAVTNAEARRSEAVAALAEAKTHYTNVFGEPPPTQHTVQTYRDKDGNLRERLVED